MFFLYLECEIFNLDTAVSLFSLDHFKLSHVE